MERKIINYPENEKKLHFKTILDMGTLLHVPGPVEVFNEGLSLIMRDKNYDRAIEYWEKVARMRGEKYNTTDFLVDILKYQIDDINHYKIKELVTKNIFIEPQDLITLRAIGDVWGALGRFDIAARFYKYLIEQDFKDDIPELYLLLGVAYSRMSQNKNSIIFFEKYLKHDKRDREKDTRILLFMGELYPKANMYKKAIDVLLEVLNTKSLDRHLAWLALGDIYHILSMIKKPYKRDEMDKIFKHYENEIINLKKYDLLGIAAFAHKDFYKAINYFNQAIEYQESPLNTVYLMLARSYLNRGNSSAAIKCLESIVGALPIFSEANSMLGDIYYFHKNDIDKAIEYYEKAVSSPLKFFGVEHDLFILGLAYYRKRSFKKAEKYFNKCNSFEKSKITIAAQINLCFLWIHQAIKMDKNSIDKKIEYLKKAEKMFYKLGNDLDPREVNGQYIKKSELLEQYPEISENLSEYFENPEDDNLIPLRHINNLDLTEIFERERRKEVRKMIRNSYRGLGIPEFQKWVITQIDQYEQEKIEWLKGNKPYILIADKFDEREYAKKQEKILEKKKERFKYEFDRDFGKVEILSKIEIDEFDISPKDKILFDMYQRGRDDKDDTYVELAKLMKKEITRLDEKDELLGKKLNKVEIRVAAIENDIKELQKISSYNAEALEKIDKLITDSNNIPWDQELKKQTEELLSDEDYLAKLFEKIKEYEKSSKERNMEKIAEMIVDIKKHLIKKGIVQILKTINIAYTKISETYPRFTYNLHKFIFDIIKIFSE